MQNIRELSSDPQNAVPIHGQDINAPNPIRDATNRTIDFALYKFLPHEQAHSIIHDYHMSTWNEEALFHDIDQLDSTEHTVPKDDHYWKAIRQVAKMIKPSTPLRPVHFADLRKYHWNLSTNVGAPFNSSQHWKDYVIAKYNFQQRGISFQHQLQRDLFSEAHTTSEPLVITDTRMTKHNLYNEIFYITREHIHIIKNGGTTSRKGQDLRFWNTAFARQYAVHNDKNDKVRLVFGAPFCLLTSELMFIWPLQVHLLNMQGSKSFMLWTFETLLGGWYRLRNWFCTYALRHELVATLDWRGFDKDARHTVLKDIHSDIIRPCFTFDEGYHPTHRYPQTRHNEDGTPVAPRLQNLWNWMTDTVLTIPLLLPDGRKIAFTHSGIFSGYFQTQILDSLYNLVMIFTILSKMGFDLDKVAIKVQGDDSIFMLLCSFIMIATSFLNIFQHYATYYFRSTVSQEKSEILPSLETAEVLKYRNRGGIPYRDETLLLVKLRHPERSNKPDAVAARCIGIAYAACGQLPQTYKICEDIYNHLVTKHNAKPSQHELDKMFRHLEHTSFRPSASQFPSFYDTLRHLVDGPSQLDNRHWPLDHFIGTPGC
jgi:hypothetical protein